MTLQEAEKGGAGPAEISGGDCHQSGPPGRCGGPGLEAGAPRGILALDLPHFPVKVSLLEAVMDTSSAAMQPALYRLSRGLKAHASANQDGLSRVTSPPENFVAKKLGTNRQGVEGICSTALAVCTDGVRRGLIRRFVHQVWAAPLMGGARAVVMFNRHVSSDEKFDEHNMTLHWSMIGLPVDLEVRSKAPTEASLAEPGARSRFPVTLYHEGAWELYSPWPGHKLRDDVDP